MNLGKQIGSAQGLLSWRFPDQFYLIARRYLQPRPSRIIVVLHELLSITPRTVPQAILLHE